MDVGTISVVLLIGMIALLVAGAAKLFDSGGGTLLWLLLLGVSVAAIWRIWTEANTD